MSHQLNSANASGKSLSNAPTQSNLQVQYSGSTGSDVHSQRRSGGSGSFGAGVATRTNVSAPRNQQSSKKQHKTGKKAKGSRPRFADEDALAESAAMKSTTSRKGQTSITHLMNFSLPPRPQQNGFRPRPRNYRPNPSWGLGSGYHAVDKARYVHANYRFIVNPRHDYHAQAIDADVHLDWSSVMQILASAQSQSSTCPICLSVATAPRMAKCGHIFCLPCLIRFMHSTDDSHPIPERKLRWKRCPICEDSVYMTEVRPVRWFIGQEGEPPREGEDIVLRLVVRQPGNTLALPRDGAEAPGLFEDIPWHFAAEATDYARVMKATESYILDQYEQEVGAIESQEREDELIYGDDTEWTKRAVQSIRHSQDRVREMKIGNPQGTQKAPEKTSNKPPIEFNKDDDESVPDMYKIQHLSKSGASSSGTASTPQKSQSSDVSGQGSSLSLIGDALAKGSLNDGESSLDQMGLASQASHIRQGENASNKPSDMPYYFYQALLHYYLSPLDIRILKVAFGDFAAFPATILPRVERVSTGHVVDDELRKRIKYLSHLPYGCEVAFLECDWTDLIGPEILEKFDVDLEKRRKRNREKFFREEKERRRAEREEDDKRLAAIRRRPTSSAQQDRFSTADFKPLPSTDPEHISSSPVDVSGTSSGSPPWSSSRRQNGSAFASLASPSTSPNAPRTVWGTAAIAPTSPAAQPIDALEVEGADGWLNGWEDDILHGNELQAEAQVAVASANEAGPGSGPGPASKKKKSKKITLMSTTARRGA